MKRIVLFSAAIGIALIIGGLAAWYWIGVKNGSGDPQAQTSQASEEAHQKGVRESVWGQLSAKQKEEIVGTWKDAQAEKMVLDDTLPGSGKTNTVDAAYQGKEVYFVEFPSKLNPTIGNVIVFADVDTFKIIGYGLRD
jgi:hypothetical protein